MRKCGVVALGPVLTASLFACPLVAAARLSPLSLAQTVVAATPSHGPAAQRVLPGATLSRYDIIDLGPGGASGLSQHSPPQVSGINVTSTDVSVGWYWANNKLTYINGTGGASLSTTGVNDKGEVVGSDGGNAFIWSEGRLAFLPRPPGMDGGATGINDGGTIGGGVDGANIWNGPGHKYLRLARPSDGWGVLGVTGVSSNGFVVAGALNGTFKTCDGGSIDAHRPILWSPSGAVSVLDSPPASVHCDGAEGLAVNNKGVVVGHVDGLDEVSNGKSYAVGGGAAEWAGGMHLLSPMAGQSASNASIAEGINNEGDVVGKDSFRTAGGSISTQAVMWPVAGPPVNLNTLIPRGSGWLLEYANAINDDGDIVGGGEYKSAQAGFLLVPPGCQAGKLDADLEYTSTGTEISFAGSGWKTLCGPVEVSAQVGNQVQSIGHFSPPSFSGKAAEGHLCAATVVATQNSGGSDRDDAIPERETRSQAEIVGRMLFAQGDVTHSDAPFLTAVRSGDPVCEIDVDPYVYQREGAPQEPGSAPAKFIDFLRRYDIRLDALSVVFTVHGLPRAALSLPSEQVTFGRSPSVDVVGTVAGHQDVPKAPSACTTLKPLSEAAALTVTGTSCVTGSFSAGDLLLDNGILYVDGDLDVTGSIKGLAGPSCAQ